ncbi:MAG: hypothetical protein LBG66_04150 [Gallionellaceae bacterium]|jgi:hypothetical protein|nr:hypothetical protein [Gallionellaceae bacterium]
MTGNSFENIFLPAKSLITEGSFLSGLRSSAVKDCFMVHDIKIADRISIATDDEEYWPWIDVRESESAAFSDKKPENYGKIMDAWEETMLSFIKKNLPDDFSKMFNDIEADLLNCCINIYVNGQNKLFDRMWEIYSQGGWPCGWKGEYPEGQLVVYSPNRS